MADDNCPVGQNIQLLKPLKSGLRPLSILYSTSVDLLEDFERSSTTANSSGSSGHGSDGGLVDPNLREIKIVLEALGARIYDLNKISVSQDTNELRRGIVLLRQPLDLQRRKTFIKYLITSVAATEESRLRAQISLEELPKYLESLFGKLRPGLRLKLRAN